MTLSKRGQQVRDLVRSAQALLDRGPTTEEHWGIIAADLREAAHQARQIAMNLAVLANLEWRDDECRSE